jgi:Tol biopolymer transport system component/ribosomal protein S27AE
VIVCKICGFENEPGAQFCGSCGGFLEWTGESTAPEAPPGTAVPTPPPPTGATPTASAEAPTTTYQTVQEPADPNAIICPSCGLANERDRVFCRRCAAELVPMATEPIGPASTSARRAALPVPPGVAIAAAVGVVVLIGAALFAAGIFGRGTPPTLASSTPGTPTVAPSSSATASASAPASASISPSPTSSAAAVPTGQIAFSSGANGSVDIFIGQADGSGVKILQTEPGNEIQPAWSPDGQKIAFAGKNGIRIVNAADGKNGVQFTNHGANDKKPEWSPDGSIIAFTSNRDRDYDIYLRHVGQNDLVRLTNVPGNDTDPSWSRANDRIAFTSTRTGDQDIWTMKSDGKGLVQLKAKGSKEDDPAWSPDGTKIAFATNREGTFFIYIMDANGKNPHRLAKSGTAVEHDPTWSPDGKFIAFARAGDPGQIVIVEVATGNQVRTLVGEGGTAAFPAWEPAAP